MERSLITTLHREALWSATQRTILSSSKQQSTMTHKELQAALLLLDWKKQDIEFLDIYIQYGIRVTVLSSDMYNIVFPSTNGGTNMKMLRAPQEVYDELIKIEDIIADANGLPGVHAASWLGTDKTFT